MNNQNVYDAYQRLDEALVARDFETAQKEVDFLYEEEFGHYQRLLKTKRKIESLRPKSNREDIFINQINRIVEKAKMTLEDLTKTSVIIKSMENYKK